MTTPAAPPLRWLVTGGGGQLGHRLAASLPDAVVLDRSGLDVTDAGAVAVAVEQHRPDVVVNAAAYTAVDAAETDEDRARAVNADGPANLAAALAESGGSLVHVSTDYVFDGTGARPYLPGDPTGPRTAYGRSKLAGEAVVRARLGDRAVVVRTAWVYGGPGANFVDTMLGLERDRDTVDVIDDQVGSPTYVADLAGALAELGALFGAGTALAADTGGLLHYAGAGTASWFDVARETFRLAGADPERVRPTDSAQFRRAAPRPAWSVLSSDAWVAAGLRAPRPWQAALADHVAAARG